MSLLSRLRGIPGFSTVPYARNSPEGLAARWVQWGASTHMNRNPIADFSGVFAGVAQPSDVWFLAGSFGGAVTRKCAIPPNKKIFVPIFNVWIWGRLHTFDLSDAFAYMQINGKPVEPDLICTKKPFTVKGVRGNPVTGSVFAEPMLVGGFSKLIDPLPAGEHEVCFRGGDGEGFVVDVTYLLTVEQAVNEKSLSYA